MKYFWILLFVMVSINIFGQNSNFAKGVVLSEKKPLQLVNIYSDIENNGTYSDENGKFEILLDKQATILVFSYIGYSSDTLFLSDSIDMNSITINLDKDLYAFEEVIVSADNNYQEQGYNKKLGYLGNKENNTLRVNKGNILAYYFQNKQKKTGKLDYVRFRFTKVKNRPKVRVNVYRTNLNQNGEVIPGDMIFQSELKTLKNSDKIFRYDFLDNVYIYKEGVFIALELVDDGEYKGEKYTLNYPSFMMTDKIDERLTYKSFMGTKWHRFSIISNETQKPYNIKVELKVNY